MNSSYSVNTVDSSDYASIMIQKKNPVVFIILALFSSQSTGQVLQQWSYGSPQFAEEIYGMAFTESGNILLGVNEDIDSIGGSDIGIWRMDRSGNRLDRTIFGSEWDDFARGLEQTGPNEYLLTGMRTASSPFRQRAHIYQLDSLGQIAWTWVHPDTLSISEFKIARKASDGTILACGNIASPGQSIRSLVASFDENGTLISMFSKNDTVREISHAAWPLPDNTWIVAGDRQMPDLTYRPYLMKIDANDSLYWRYTYDEQVNGGSQNITGLADGNLLLIGEGYPAPGIFAFDIFLRKVDPNGQTIWYHTYGDTGTDAGFGVVESPTDHSLTATGYAFNPLAGNTDMILLHTDSLGNELDREYAGLPGIDFGNVILQAQDTVWAAGFSNVGLDSQPLLVKHSWVTGTDGIDALAASELRLFPSPAMPGEAISLAHHFGEALTVHVIDLAGRAVSSTQIPAGRLATFPAPSKEGIYLCQLLLDNRLLTFRLIVR